MTTTLTSIVPGDASADLRLLLEHPTGGIRDPEAAKRARERMDRMREENRRRFGEQAVAVELIRQARDRA
jgi:hypothetical protein